MLVGILADGHGCPSKLAEGIRELKKRQAERLIHLGDVVDMLKPETVEECVRMLIENRIEGVMGNHEYSFVMHHFKRYPHKFSEPVKRYVRSLPQYLEICGVCFTHFSPQGGPYGLFALTDDEGYERILRDSAWPIVVNGHSHDPRVYCRSDGASENIRFDARRPFELREDARYILTCGALEDSYCSVLDLGSRRFEIVSLRK